MMTPSAQPEARPVILHFGRLLNKISDREFFAFCEANRDLRIERTSDGDLIIMPPTGGETGNRNFSLTTAFGGWVEADGSGLGFDSSTGFCLPNGAIRSPDLAWVRRMRWEQLSSAEKIEFPPICPDFVLELRSSSDSLSELKAKMAEYIENGAELGWLLDPMEKRLYIYQPNLEVICLEKPDSVSGDPVLSGFVLSLRGFW
jgi:Uma2 family endonuclease